MPSLETERLKRAVIKEELVALSGDFKKAIILNQFLYWSERVKDFDQFIAEEQERASQEGASLNIQPRRGWIYKSAKDLSQETMLNLSPNTIRKHTEALIEAGYLERRQNPHNTWDNTYQYRVNLLKIQEDLLALGYTLAGYRFNLELVKAEDLKKEPEPPQKAQAEEVKAEPRNADTAPRSLENCAAIPETITEISNRDTNLVESSPAQESGFSLHAEFEEALTYIRTQTGQDSLKHEYLLNSDLECYGVAVLKKATELAVLKQSLHKKEQDIYSYGYIRYFIAEAQELLEKKELQEEARVYAEQELARLCQRIIK
ncbi:hypothetical protein [Fuchsiella alkaliacetigena]|uniref:hypothetical protein n=1 Tax=Fuchsiella alkaliacetigena TaxID=957042 RepID=UPI00200A6270|nr:hypothetical protein [Fuchsiella alkaliacetigena]MCK8824879.1 hypothetical protein [Fuchsiella alkaliacetigena]